MNGCILHHLAIDVETRNQLRGCEGLEDRISRCPYSTLYGQEGLRNAPHLQVAGQNLGHVLSYLCGCGIGCTKGTGLFGQTCLHDSSYFPGLDGNEIVANAVLWRQDRYRHATVTAVGRLGGVVDQA